MVQGTFPIFLTQAQKEEDIPSLGIQVPGSWEVLLCPVLWLPGSVGIPCGCGGKRLCFLRVCGPFTTRMPRSPEGLTPAHSSHSCLIHSCYLLVPRILCSLGAIHKVSCRACPEPHCQASCPRWGRLLSVNLGPLGASLCED